MQLVPKDALFLPGETKETVDVWQMPLACDFKECQRLEKLLSQRERENARRFRREGDRLRYIQRRAFLRCILGRVTGRDTTQLEFSETLHGKPLLLNGPPTMAFNLSHAEEIVLCAISTSGAVGIDVERINPAVEVLSLASEHFSLHDYELLQSASRDHQRALFFKLWTAKEAYLKGLGLGLSGPLREIKMEWEDSRIIQCGFRNCALWNITKIPCGSRYFASLATPKPIIVANHILTCLHDFRFQRA